MIVTKPSFAQYTNKKDIWSPSDLINYKNILISKEWRSQISVLDYHSSVPVMAESFLSNILLNYSQLDKMAIQAILLIWMVAVSDVLSVWAIRPANHENILI